MGKNLIWYQTARRGAMSRLIDLDVERQTLTDVITECDAALQNGHSTKTLADAVNDDIAVTNKARGRGMKRGRPNGKSFHGQHWTQQPENQKRLKRILAHAAATKRAMRGGKAKDTAKAKHWGGTHTYGNPNRAANAAGRLLDLLPNSGVVITPEHYDDLATLMANGGYPFIKAKPMYRRNIIRQTLERLAAKGRIEKLERGQYRKLTETATTETGAEG